MIDQSTDPDADANAELKLVGGSVAFNGRPCGDGSVSPPALGGSDSDGASCALANAAWSALRFHLCPVSCCILQCNTTRLFRMTWYVVCGSKQLSFNPSIKVRRLTCGSPIWTSWSSVPLYSR